MHNCLRQSKHQVAHAFVGTEILPAEYSPAQLS